MDKGVKDVYVFCEKEEAITFSFGFKMILYISICLTGIISLAGTIFIFLGVHNSIWNTKGLNYLLNHGIFFLSVILCFISLVTIAILKKPFSKILVRCFMGIGSLLTLAALIFPQINGYKTSGFDIFTTDRFTLFDGSLLMIGLLGILFSQILKYGFLYQKSSEMTI